MKLDYSLHISPPAMIVPVSVSPVSGGSTVEAHGLIDTGAAISAVPERVRDELNLMPARPLCVKGACDREWRVAPGYYVVLAIGEWSFKAMVVSLPRDGVVVGRDVLNRFVLKADGPGGTFELAR